jgi:hypothetical protein
MARAASKGIEDWKRRQLSVNKRRQKSVFINAALEV